MANYFKDDNKTQIETSKRNDLIFQNDNFSVKADSTYDDTIKDNKGNAIKDSDGLPFFNDKKFGTIEIDGLNELNQDLNKKKVALDNEIKNSKLDNSSLESKQYQLKKLALILEFLSGLKQTIQEKLDEYKDNELKLEDVNNKYVYIASGLLNKELYNAL